MMIELEHDKETSFTLEMKIDGDAGGDTPKMRFSIVSENFTFSIPAERVENGVYEVHCPKLKGILPPGDYAVNVEVFIDDKHFIPMSDTIRLKETVKPTVTMSTRKPAAKPVTEASIAITVTESKAAPKKPSLTKTDSIIQR